MTRLCDVYEGHAEVPQVPAVYEAEICQKPIAKRQMIRTSEGLLPGHIILLWRVQFGSYTNQSQPHKYFATTYGIDAYKAVDFLLAEGYLYLEEVKAALRHLPARDLKAWLTEKKVKGLSKLKRSEVEELVFAHFSPEELSQRYSIRAYLLTEKGRATLDKYPEIVAKHPQKSF